MNVLIAGDSRCSRPLKNGWSDIFVRNHPDIKTTLCRASVELVTFSIYELEPFILKFEDGFFDLAFIQSGFNEGVEFWPERIFSMVIGNRFRKSALKSQRGDSFIYIDRESEKEIFDLLKRKCKKVVFIGFHSLKKWKTDKLDETYNTNARTVNEIFSKLATHYISLPQSNEWAKEHCIEGDVIHYNSKGIEHILTEVEKHL